MATLSPSQISTTEISLTAKKMDASRTASALQFAQVAVGKWELIQVELQGKYSLERMRAFYAYALQSRWYRVLFWCIVTPIPSLVINILLDILPLAQPSAGRDANYAFWVRLAIFTIVVVFWMWVQTGYLTPALGMTRRHALTTAVVVASAHVIYGYVLTCFIPMPIPFLLVISAPVFSLTTSTMFTFFFGRRILSNAALRASFNRAGGITGIQLCLTLIYPAFIYGFNSISPKYQTPYMILVPVIKIIAKNITSRLVGSNDDLKPVELIFNIDCFNAIYVSLAMQRATTVSTSMMVMLIDVAQGCVSVFDVYQGFQPLKRFMNELPAGHPLRGKNFLEVAIALDQESNLVSREKQTENATTKPVKSSKLKTYGLRASTKVFISPCPSANTSRKPITQQIYSAESRDLFLRATRKLLFTTEFVILVEYTEVIMPVFYSLLMAATFYLPNRAFYSTIAGIDEDGLWSMVTSVLMYATLELLSLAVMDLVLHQITGVSAMRQAGFVLDTQREPVQSKLLSWVLYAVQNSVEHFGADFSFQFKWLHSH